MDSVPQLATIRSLHPADRQPSREKLFMFISGWLGGAELYVQHIGPPMLCRRLLLAIGEDERAQSVACSFWRWSPPVTEEAPRERLLA